jgi:hypothetical protein
VSFCAFPTMTLVHCTTFFMTLTEKLSRTYNRQTPQLLMYYVFAWWHSDPLSVIRHGNIMRGRISVVGKPTLTILVLRFLRKNCSNFLDQLTVVSILIWVRRSPVRTINRRRLYLNLLRNKVVGCLLGLSLPDVCHRMYDNVRSHQTHRVLIQTKQDGNVASVESHPPCLVDKRLETTEVTSHNATMRNIALSGVYSG